jgi:transcriptional regulator with XRE-family HTH domain
MDVTSELRRARERHGLSQRQLAYRALTNQQAISRIERGTVSPTLEMLQRIATALGEELTLELQPRQVPFEDAQLRASARRPPAQRLELSLAWNEFAGEIAAAGARARGEL